MQENNNFETIISTWRRLSGETVEPMFMSMSGDSSENQPFKKKENESELLIPDHKPPVAALAGAGVAAVVAEAKDSKEERKENKDDNEDKNSEEKQCFIRPDREDSKESSGDTKDREEKDDKDYLDNDSPNPKSPETKHQNEKFPDKVDSVYLRPPPPHKARSTASTQDEEDCGIKCLYYTLQCCDCVLM